MNVVEAILEANKLGTSIRREVQNEDNEISLIMEIKPTNTPECCIIWGFTPAKESDEMMVCPRWQPNLDDFLSNDWTVTEQIAPKIQEYLSNHA